MSKIINHTYRVKPGAATESELFSVIFWPCINIFRCDMGLIYKEIQVYTATYQLLFPKLLTHLKTLKCLSSREYINPQKFLHTIPKHRAVFLKSQHIHVQIGKMACTSLLTVQWLLALLPFSVFSCFAARIN